MDPINEATLNQPNMMPYPIMPPHSMQGSRVSASNAN